MKDHVEDLGGNGPAVAAYLRVSTGKAVKEGYSLEVQYEILNKLKKKRKPSRIYWFIDPGKSGNRDYDKRKMNTILALRERGEIQELWTCHIDRMGRERRKLLPFYYEFCDAGGKIVTPEREYSTEDFASEFAFFFEASMAERTTKQRTADMVASKAKSFKKKHWNKRAVPRGYTKKVWLKKNVEYDPLIKTAGRLLARHRCIAEVHRKLNRKFKKLLGPKPLSINDTKCILSDPVYVGRPEHMGAVVADSSLTFITEETLQKNLKILAEIHKKSKPERIGPLEDLATAQPITFLEVLKTFNWVHRGCGGKVKKNGTDKKTNPRQQLFRCKKCHSAWRLPPVGGKDDGAASGKVKKRRRKRKKSKKSRQEGSP